jgi:GT2 family glycosyltransferase
MLELPDAGILGCRLLDSDGTLQTNCVQSFPTILNQLLNAEILQNWFSGIRLWTSAATFEPVRAPVPVEVICGACMMIRRDVFDAVGGFSPDYFMYGEDVDLCYKTRTAGLTNYYFGGAEIVHHGGGSTQRTLTRFSDVMTRESVYRFLTQVHGDRYGLGYRLTLTGAAIGRLTLLALLLPPAAMFRRTPAWRKAAAKWAVILRWGVGLERWVNDYDEPHNLQPDGGKKAQVCC